MSADATIRARKATSRALVLLARRAELAADSASMESAMERNRLELAARRLALHDARRSLAATLARRTVVEVTGSIDGSEVSATWTDGRLVGSRELIRRAEMLVAMGEALTTGDDHAELDDEASTAPDEPPQRRLTASLAGPPTVVALTLMRACTRVSSVDLPVEP
jgi:hypothetical protein